MNSFAGKLGALAAGGLGLAVGFAILASLPVAQTNIYFLFAPLLLLAAVLFVLLNNKAVVLALLFSRVLMDPLLQATKINVMGENLGLGAAINLSVVAFAAFLAFRNRKILFENDTHKWWMIFLAICMAGIATSPFQGKAVKLFVNLVSYLAVAMMAAYFVQTQNDRKFWIKVLFMSSLLPVFFGDVDLLMGGRYVYGDAGPRVKGSFSHPNILSFYLVFVSALIFYIFHSPQFTLNRLEKWALSAFFLNVIVLLLATKTRNAWIALWLIFFIYGILCDRRYFLISVILPPFLLLSPTVQDRVRDLFQGTGGNLESSLNSFAWRIELWKRSLSWLGNRAFIGNGLGSFEPLSINFFPSFRNEGTPAHNVYVELMFELGLFGLLAYLAVFSKTLKEFFKRAGDRGSRNFVPYSIAIAYVISYMFSCAGDNMNDYLAFNWYFWFLMGVLLKNVPDEDESLDYYPVI